VITDIFVRSPARALGFSLIEMLVALVVLSLSLGVLYQAATGAIRNVRVAAEYTDAVMLAESVLADQSYMTQESYSASGQFQTFQWSVSSWPAVYDDGLDPEERAIAADPLQFLKVVVSWPGRGGAPREVDLLTVVPLREPSS
jgi:general secretion pathway protein I